jgi:hypothetical protein
MSHFFDHYKDYDPTDFMSTLPEIQKTSLSKPLISMAMLITSKGMTESVCRKAASYMTDNDIIITDNVDAVYYDIIRYCYLVSPDLINRRNF